MAWQKSASILGTDLCAALREGSGIPPSLRLITAMKHPDKFIAAVTAGLAVACCLAVAAVGDEDKPWRDNERKFKSDDPTLNFRRSEHFRIAWGQGAGANKEENADFGGVTEQLVQGNLQMLEKVWHRYHDPQPGGLGFHNPGVSSNAKDQDGNCYRANLTLNNTGIWAGGAWGSCDEWGLPMFALPPSYLAYDPPSGATPHEYGHTVLINAGGFNDTPYDGMWHEATANWLMLQFNNSYPGPGGIGTQPFLSLPHGRNYYDAWLIWEHLRETPGYGSAFVNKMWTEARGNKNKGGEYIFDAMVRLAPSGNPDPYNAIKDAIGHMAARSVTWDYQRQVFFQKLSPRTMDPFTEMYRRAYTELTRRAADSNWYRVPFAHAPMQGGYNVVPIALPGKTGQSYPVSINFKPLWDATRHADWRATLVAVNDAGEARYSTMWNAGVNSITLSTDENRLFLVVAATPDFMPFEGFQHPLLSDLPLQPQAYEVAFVNTKADAYQSKPSVPAGVAGKPHANGGGFVAATAKVAASAYVGPDAMVLGSAQVTGKARIEDFAVVMDRAEVSETAVLSGHALVRETAQVSGHGKVRDWATVQGGWKISGNGRALERAYLADRGELTDHATIKGAASDNGGAKVGGHAIKEGDCANSANVDHQTLMCWVWGIDQKYADDRPDNESLYCNYQFNRSSPIYALDRFGVMHGYLMGSPQTLTLDDTQLRGALQLDGQGQHVELKRDVADFADTTISLWLNWAGGSAGQRILHFGDGGKKYAYLTPKDAATGKLKFVISTGGPQSEQALVGPAPLPKGTWTHVAITLSGDTATLYVDGKAVAKNPAMTLKPDMVLGPNTLAGNDCMFLGRGPQGGYYLGWLTDFRVYVQAQEAAVIATLAGQIHNRSAKGTAAAKDTAPTKTSRAAFLMPPTPLGDSAVVMSAPKAAADAAGVEYSFIGSGAGGHASGWISSNRWTDCRLEPGKTYAYIFKLRDQQGNETPPSPPQRVTLPPLTEVLECAFESPPKGVSPSAIRMTVAKPEGTSGAVEYQFASIGGKPGAWQSSRTWTDSGLTEGSKHSYSVRMRDAAGTFGKPSPVAAAVVRDDTPPARYAIGEWQTLPFATVENSVSMKAMSVTGANECPKIEADAVEYSFHCVAGGGPDSGWIATPAWQTPALPNGLYQYAFKLRDKSPQLNETPWSSNETAVVSALTGYHDCPVSQLARQPEGALVSFQGKVTKVDTASYTVTAGGTSIKVVPRSVAAATDAKLANASVSVQGCLWIRNKEKCVVWAELRK